MDARDRGLDSPLARATLFAGLDCHALRAIEAVAQPRYYSAGQVICRQGEPSDSLFVLRGGFAQAFVAPASGSEPTLVARLRPGDVIGEIGLLAAVPRSAMVVARSEAVALEIRADDFARLLTSEPRLQENLTHVLAGRLARRNANLHNVDTRHLAVVAVGAGRRDAAASVLTAARRASRRPLAIVDVCAGRPPQAPIPGTADVMYASSSMPELLERIDTLSATHQTIAVVVDHDRIDPALLGSADRVLAFAADHEAAALAPKLALARHVADLVAFGGSATDRPELRTLRRCDTVLAPRDVAWLGRHLARTKLGLALGAGGAKAFAHAGVIQCLEREGYAIDYVAGSSMGAVVAVWLALGMSGSEIAALLHERFASPDVTEAIFRRGAAGGGDEVFRRIFRETTGDRSFEDCVIPATVMTADLAARRPWPITTGSLWEALMASLAIPGLYPPWSRGEHRLVDAVCLTPVPVQAVRAAGADVIVAVNILGRETLPRWPGHDDGEARPGNKPRDTVIEALELGQLDASAREAAGADVTITPVFGPGTWRHTQRGALFLDAGRQAAEGAVGRLAMIARPTVAPSGARSTGHRGGSARMEVPTRRVNDVLIAEMVGRLDSHTSATASTALNHIARDGHLKLVLNAQGLESVSSAGLRAILVAAKLLEVHGGAMKICNANPHVKQVLEVSGMSSLLHLYDNERDALAAFV
jgi:NTE family protein